MPGYVSPFRVTIAKSGNRYHWFSQANGGEMHCRPETCREHWREANWTSQRD